MLPYRGVFQAAPSGEGIPLLDVGLTTVPSIPPEDTEAAERDHLTRKQTQRRLQAQWATVRRTAVRNVAFRTNLHNGTETRSYELSGEERYVSFTTDVHVVLLGL